MLDATGDIKSFDHNQDSCLERNDTTLQGQNTPSQESLPQYLATSDHHTPENHPTQAKTTNDKNKPNETFELEQQEKIT